jgi:hypothetical protein
VWILAGCASTSSDDAAGAAAPGAAAGEGAARGSSSAPAARAGAADDGAGKAAAGVASVVGTWDLTLTFEGEPQKITLEIAAAADGGLTGTWIGPHRTNPLVDFTWDGTTLTFVRNVNRQGNPVALRHRATVEGDAMSGVISAAGEADVDFSAKRQRAAG